MTIRTKVAFWCYFLLMTNIAGMGINYMLRSEFMWYHSVAVGMPWSEVPPNFQILILALIKAVGGLWITVALCIFILLFLPFRQGAPWSRWAVPSLILIQNVAIMPAMAHVTFNTPATPPWFVTIVSVVIAVAAFAISITEPKK